MAVCETMVTDANSPKPASRPSRHAWVMARRLAACGWLACAGCLIPSAGSQRVAPYRPVERGRHPELWIRTASAPARTPAPLPSPVPNPSPAPGAAPTLQTNWAAVSGTQVSSLALRRGDHVTITLTGPVREVIEDVLDESGCVTLTHVGRVVIEGRTPSAAERLIERAYVDGGIYKRVNVNLVAQENEYFVQGEVRNAGRYPLTSEVTLMQAIATAGGPSDYAKMSRIEIYRGGQVSDHDAKKIESRQTPDPIVMRGDRIVVRRSILGN
jgi:polysaccharide export outer membrane protein